ncbi:MAG: dephospho-CoA kinase [Pseudomonadota bacterium]|nr:dephospho-CoA kinase [Pseudomonadota bacterium]
MIRIALTGSIGMGKSTVARMFAAAGVPVFDADSEVRRMQGPGGSLVAAIGAAFPGALAGRALDRERLASIVLADPAKLAELEAITHPAVAVARAEFIARNQHEPALLFDIPLLFEIKGEEAFDKVIVVSAPADEQRRRVLKRPGMTEARLAAIRARQLPDADKRGRADFVIDTAGELSTTEAQVRDIIACLGLAARD